MTGRMAIFVLAAVLLVAAVGFLGSEEEERSAFAGAYTSFSAAPDGMRGLWALTERLDYAPTRVMHNFEALPEEGTLVSVAPAALATGFLAFFFDSGTFTDEEVKEVTRWVEAGNTFVLIHNNTTELHDAFAILSLQGPSQAPVEVVLPGQEPGEPPMVDAEAARAWPPRLAAAEPALEQLALLSGVGGLRVEADARTIQLSGSPLPEESRPKGWTPLVQAADGRLIGAELRRGEGRFVVLSAPYMATNRGLADEDNALLLARLLRPERGQLHFDEFHHGFRHEQGLSNYLRDSSLWMAVCQLLLLLLFLGWRAASRFGPALGFYEEEARGSGDYVRAMSLIYERGGHDAHALSVLQEDLERALVERHRLRGELRGAALLDELDRLGEAELTARVRRVQGEVQAVLAARRRRPAKVVAASAQLARLIGELRQHRIAGAKTQMGSL